MRIAVLGAGVAGITTAWELINDGHTVTVFDKSGGIAEGASFASPGWVGVAGLAAWDTVSPLWPKVGPAGLTASPQWLARPGTSRWLAALKKHTSPARLPTLLGVNLELAALSTARLHKTLSNPGVDIKRSQGMMLLMRTDADSSMFATGVQHLKDRDMKVRELDPTAAKKLEPGLSDDTTPSARWWLPDDEVINGRQWLGVLKADALRRGCVFQMNTQVTALHPGGRLTCKTDQMPLQNLAFDGIVVCVGHHGNDVLTSIGVKLPLLSMNQCVLSAPIRDPHFAPVSGVFDVQHRVSITRTGQRIKASSATGLWPGQDATPVYKQLYQSLNDWFPGSASLHGVHSCAQTWQSTCSFTPDCLPLVGASGVPNTWLNLGFGAKGWTQAPGAARLLADQLKGTPQISLRDSLSPDRFN